MKVKAYAKINLTLDIPKIRDDGYHELRSVFQQISLYDELEISVSESKGENDILLTCNDPKIPCNAKNLCWKAANAFLNKYGFTNKTVSINLLKNIPSGAGLGGGSSDCAETLKALNKILNVKASDEELEKIGVTLGADVPFFIKGGTQLAEGIGEKLTVLKLNYPKNLYAVLIKPNAELLTASIYKAFDGLPKENLPKESTKVFLERISDGTFEAFCHTTNMLEPAAVSYCPDIKKIEALLMKCNAVHSMMTGSGSAVFGIFTDEESAKKALETANKELKTVFGTICRFK